MTYTPDPYAIVVGPDDAADYLGISRRTLDRLATSGAVVFYDIPAGRVFNLGQLDEYLSSLSETGVP